MKKYFTPLLCCLLLLSVAYVLVLSFTSSGTTKVLNAVRDIRPGFTKQQVVDYMGREPQISPGDYPTGFIDQLLGPRDGGEYLFYFMGIPPRNLIIYMNEDGVVEFVTWDST